MNSQDQPQQAAGGTVEANDMRAQWANHFGWREHTRHACLFKLANRRHSCNSYRCYQDGEPGYLKILDHFEFWRDQAGRYWLTAHPYGSRGLTELVEFCTPRGIDYHLYEPTMSWYSPGITLLVVLGGAVGATETRNCCEAD